MNPKVQKLCARFEPVGSRVTCNPPPQDTDADYLVMAKPGQGEALKKLLGALGWERGGSECLQGTGPVGNQFASYTFGDDNYIIAETEFFFNRFMAASSVAKRLNLLSKPDRIALFQAVLYGNPC